MEKSYFSMNHWYARDYLRLKQHMAALFGHFSKKNVSFILLQCKPRLPHLHIVVTPILSRKAQRGPG